MTSSLRRGSQAEADWADDVGNRVIDFLAEEGLDANRGMTALVAAALKLLGAVVPDERERVLGDLCECLRKNAVANGLVPPQN